jgi:hypothetical protein
VLRFADDEAIPLANDVAYGAVIRWENYMPLLRRAMYARGVQSYCAPAADQGET